MNVMFERCAGLDVHKQSVVACRILAGPLCSVLDPTAKQGPSAPPLPNCCASVTG